MNYRLYIIAEESWLVYSTWLMLMFWALSIAPGTSYLARGKLHRLLQLLTTQVSGKEDTSYIAPAPHYKIIWQEGHFIHYSRSTLHKYLAWRILHTLLQLNTTQVTGKEDNFYISPTQHFTKTLWSVRRKRLKMLLNCLVPASMLKHMWEVISIVHGSVAKEFQTRRFLSVEGVIYFDYSCIWEGDCIQDNEMAHGG